MLCRKGWVWAVAVLMMGAVGLSGCSGARGGGATDQGGKPPEQVRSSEPANKPDPQVITLNLGTEPPNLDHNRTTDSASFDVLANVMEGLVRLGPGGKIEKGSGQAAGWTISPDGKKYTFTLKDGLKWHDGKPVTAHDFVYSWFRALDPKTASEYAYQLYYIKGGEAWNTLKTDAPDFAQKYADLKAKVGLKALNDKTIEVELETPTPYFLSLMAFPTYLPTRQDLVETHGDKFGADADKMAFNGPFVVKSWVHESELILEKNPNYWDAGKVKLEKVTFKMVKDSNTAINMFEANELDAVGVPGEFIAQYREKGLKTMAEASTFYITLNLKNRIFANSNIRKALSLALDRKGFIDNVAKNGSVPAAGYVPPSITMVGVDKPFRELSGTFIPPAADVARARELLAAGLKELGLDKLPTVKLLISDTSTAKRFAQGFQEMWNKNLGIQVEIEPVAFKIRLQRTRQGDFEMVYAGWIGDYNDPMTFMDMWVTDGGFNDAKWSNKQYDGLIKQAKETADQQVRLKNMAEAEKLLMAELPIIPLYHSAANWVEKTWYKGALHFPVGGSLDLKYVYVEGKER